MNILKEKRLEKNMTLEEVGNLIGVGKSTVRKWENGMIENMGRDKIVAISKALGISPLDILGMNENDLPQSTIAAIYNQLEKPRQENVYRFAEKQLEEQQTKNKKFSSLEEYRKKVPDAIDTLAAHSADRTKKYTDQEIENIKDILDSMIEEHKNNK